MITNKHIGKLIGVFLAVMVCLCLLAVLFSEKLSAFLGDDGLSTQYQTVLFNTEEVLDINIEIDQEKWEYLKENALAEEYQECNVTIDGQTFYQVGIRPKGNTSLSSIANNPTTDRYSFKLEFDQFVDGQTCFGLDKLVLNNSYADATYMKEALIYDMFQFLGADAPLYNYAKISVNGEYWGLYLALEAVEDSFMLRNYGSSKGSLYKPDSMEMGGQNKENADTRPADMPVPEQRGEMPQGEMPQGEMPQGEMPQGEMPQGEMPQGEMPQGGGGMPGGRGGMPPGGRGGGMPQGEMPQEGSAPGNMPNMADESRSMPENMPNPAEETPKMPENGQKVPSGGRDEGRTKGGGGANLNYTDDNPESYQTLWEGAMTDITESDQKRVIEALKNIAVGTSSLETYMDIENLVKYMAVHVFSVNQDSLSGNMAHNYYLYEYNGKLNLLPWDYNLALGGMGQGDDASSIINDPIDTPFSGTNFFDTLLADENYADLYHYALQTLVDTYIDGGGLDAFYNRTRNLIDTLVETDPTAFYDYQDYQVAADTLYQTIKLRGESIRGQLSGTIPSTDEGQRADSSALIDATGIDISTMGSMMGGNRRDSKNPVNENRQENNPPANP